MEERMKQIRVVVVEDEEKLLASIASKIEAANPAFTVVAACSDGQSALEAVGTHRAHAVFTDIRMPVMDGLELARQISLQHPDVSVVILSGYSDFSYTRQAIKYGVFNYLLKPLEQEALVETLEDLQRTIAANGQWKSIKTRYSDGYQAAIAKPHTYALLIVNFGNYAYDADDELLNDFYYQKMAALSWHSIMQTVFPKYSAWYVADEDRVNKKTVCLVLADGESVRLQEKAEALRKVLRALCPELPINLCISEGAFTDADVWMHAQRMRNILKQRILLAKESTFLLERDELSAADDVLGIVRLRINDNFRAKLLAADIQGAEEELRLILRYMLKNNVSQQDFQRVLLYVLRTIEFMPRRKRVPAKEDWQPDILRCICEQNRPDRIVDHVLAAISRCFHGEPAAQEDDRQLSERLMAYVDANYLTLNNLDDITTSFFYNYAYLARLFKKQTGQSISRYVFNKRMTLAKKLIGENDGMNIGEIARLCGYEDARYFSRLFKSDTGMTPTEYKTSL